MNDFVSTKQSKSNLLADENNSNGPATPQMVHGTSDHPADFEQIKNIKQTLRQGITKFNESPSKGIKMLVDAAILKDEDSIVKFLLNNTDLSKTAIGIIIFIIGDYLGEGKPDNIRIMHKFIDSFDFSSVAFVPALKTFLQAFRLPGEAQKIDRLMEKFAARYCQTNPSVFAKADVAVNVILNL